MGLFFLKLDMCVSYLLLHNEPSPKLHSSEQQQSFFLFMDLLFGQDSTVTTGLCHAASPGASPLGAEGAMSKMVHSRGGWAG